MTGIGHIFRGSDSGLAITSALEIVVFAIGDHHFGVQGTKLLAILPRPASADTARLRERVVPIVTLRRLLQLPDGDTQDDQTLIIVDCGQRWLAFAVDRVEGVHHAAWNELPTVAALETLPHSPVVAVVRIAEQQVTMLDFAMLAEQFAKLPTATVDTASARSGKQSSLQAWLKPPRTVAEQAPTWEVEIEESPAETNPRLWQTYRAELADRSRHLMKLLQHLRQAPQEASLWLEVTRTLQTIKAASLVVPVNEAVRLTEWLERRVANTGPTRQPSPLDCLALYADWLQELASPHALVSRVLVHGRDLLERLQQFGR